jgi:hypothetical protein
LATALYLAETLNHPRRRKPRLLPRSMAARSPMKVMRG